ncbi:MAG TPA: class I SAM-dependent methyltransferase [Edaphocola sp.]|nr:class I SAM-dependent methyltransferase [Edaphocola sp.]
MEEFENRLKKNFKLWSKWAKRKDIQCYRLYDHDIPQFPFCIEIYGEYVHCSEYSSLKSNKIECYQIEDVALKITDILNVPIEHLFFKQRKILSRRAEQYEKLDSQQQSIIVQENGLNFKVNLTDYLDTGLFLDHRPLRTRFLTEAKGKKVLNLFSYTGSFSVYAAKAGASLVTTVDLSKTYLQWAIENFKLNDLPLDGHLFVQSDVMQFLKLSTTELYDLIIVDPPSFSNSKSMKGTWDTQRDHPTMLHFLLKHCAPGARIYFSNNFRNFKPIFSKLRMKNVKDISLATIPEDFRNKEIHKCYQIDVL